MLLYETNTKETNNFPDLLFSYVFQKKSTIFSYGESEKKNFLLKQLSALKKRMKGYRDEIEMVRPWGLVFRNLA